MRRIVLVIAGLLAAWPARAPAQPPDPSGTAARATCDVELNVTDPDPKGLNVRSGPAASAAVVAVLKRDGEWTTVHAVAQEGDWLSIDRAETVDDNAPGGSRPALTHSGWVHVSKLGVSELQTGSGTSLRDRPATNAKVLLRIHGDDHAPTNVFGCHGRFIQVRHGHAVGWTDRWCNNERTTCS